MAIQRRDRTAGGRRTTAADRSPAVRRPRKSAASSRQAPRQPHGAAQRRLRRFRQGTVLAVAVTGLFLILWGIEDAPAQEIGAPPQIQTDSPAEPPDPARSVEEATGTVRDLALEFVAALPRIAIAVVLLALAAAFVRLVRAVLRRALIHWERAEAATAMSGVLVWLIAIGAALSVIAGDARALVGSIGLLGLALSWALQAPIESFAGWLVNSFQAYYRVGDRIAVGEVFGDVYRIDFLTTTVWEAGGPEKPVQGAQPTGALITFPNSEVLRANVVNYTRGFPYVWDEVVIGVSNETDLRYAARIVEDVARRVVGPVMLEPVRAYRSLLEEEGLAYDVADEPQVFVALTEAWTELTVRYVVDARERRRWASRLNLEISMELARPEHRGRVAMAYPVTRVDLRTVDSGP